jgi:hypothetical protein
MSTEQNYPVFMFQPQKQNCNEEILQMFTIESE